MKKTGTLFIISAPSGAGKSSLVDALISKWDHQTHKLQKVVTYTTKQPRHSDQNGIDYHFISPDEFQSKIVENFFLDWSCNYGAYYGCPANIMDSITNGISHILIVDRSGAENIKSKVPNAVLIWIHTSNLTVLRERLEKRNTESIEQINKRLLLAQQELVQETNKPLFHHYVLNDLFDQALAEIQVIVNGKISPQP